jgi:NitT/TauT family transport system ATP-binding protein
VPRSDPKTPKPAPAVVLRRIEHTYRSGIQALAPVDLDLEHGELVSIIGPSGCGKSTLLRIVAGLEQATAGTIERNVASGGHRTTGCVFQQPTLLPWCNVLANTRLPLDLSGVPRADADRRAGDALGLVGLREFAEALPHELSGGMQMRTSIARALVTTPSLLLMDEPFGALDELTRGRLDRELLTLRAARGFTVLFVTHSLQEAVFLSTRVLVMTPRPGRISAELRIEEPYPRDDAFRLSPRFAELCGQLSGMLICAGAVP